MDQNQRNASNQTSINDLHNHITRHTKPIPQFSEKQLARFWRRVDRRGPSECWPWKGGVTVGKWGARYGQWNGFRPHRITYTLLVGPIPAGHTLDHLKESGICATSLCCNPAHCEPVTQSENTKRYRASLPRICKRGHRMAPTGNCGQCIRITTKAYYEAHRDELLAYHRNRRQAAREASL
jgi:hypothetical protein